MSKLIASIAAIAVLGSLAVAGSAGAASGTGFYSFNFSPGGTLYKEVPTPGQLHLEGGVVPNDDVVIAKATVSQSLGLGRGINLVPHNNVTPPCTAITPENANFNTETALSKCPNSAVGEGTSVLYLAGAKDNVVTDSVTISFNAGFDNKGRPSQIIQGYSGETNHGIGFTAYQKETDQGSDLVMDIPRLTADSSVPSFTTTLPGNSAQTAKDPNYVQASCPTGSWTANADYTIANRGKDGSINNAEVIPSPDYSQACVGNIGKPRLKVKLKGPRKVKAKRKAKFKVRIRNKGTATAKRLKLVGKGAGKGQARSKNIAPGNGRTIRMKMKVRGKKGKRVKVKVKVLSRKQNPRFGATKVKLK